MLIPENLRQEHMPMMVFALCKLVKMGKYNDEELINRLFYQFAEKTDNNLPGMVLDFAEKGEFVKKENDVFVTDFTNEELSSTRSFSRAILRKIDMDESKKFSSVLQWLLWEDLKFEELETHKDVKSEMDENDKLKSMNINENYVHGFLFWTEFLGITVATSVSKGEKDKSLTDRNVGRSMGCYNFSLEDILFEVINDRKKELLKRGNMPVSEFLEIMADDISFIPLCFNGTTVCFVLSYALRVLERMGVVYLSTIDDSPETWHLTKSETFTTGNSFTNIKVV